MKKWLLLLMVFLKTTIAGRCDPQLFINNANKNYAQFIRFVWLTAQPKIEKIPDEATCIRLRKELLELRRQTILDGHDCTDKNLKREFRLMQKEYEEFFLLIEEREEDIINNVEIDVNSDSLLE